MFNDDRAWNYSTNVGGASDRPMDDDEQMYTSQVMESNAIRQVHSEASIRAMVARAGKQKQQPGYMAPKMTMIQEGLAVPPPIVATTAEREGTRKVDASNLPFLYRHPAV
jgi:hypothetical protein